MPKGHLKCKQINRFTSNDCIFRLRERQTTRETESCWKVHSYELTSRRYWISHNGILWVNFSFLTSVLFYCYSAHTNSQTHTQSYAHTQCGRVVVRVRGSLIYIYFVSLSTLPMFVGFDKELSWQNGMTSEFSLSHAPWKLFDCHLLKYTNILREACEAKSRVFSLIPFLNVNFNFLEKKSYPEKFVIFLWIVKYILFKTCSKKRTVRKRETRKEEEEKKKWTSKSIDIEKIIIEEKKSTNEPQKKGNEMRCCYLNRMLERFSQ